MSSTPKNRPAEFPLLGRLTVASTRLIGRLTRHIPGLQDGFLAPLIGLFMTVLSPLLLRRLGGPAGASTDLTSAIVATFASDGLLPRLIAALFGHPSGPGPDEAAVVDASGGSGPYGSRVFEHAASLPGHTLYAPATAPPWPLPVLCWANGFGLRAGTMFANFLREIASHGFLVVANGPMDHGGRLGNITRGPELIDAVDWVAYGAALDDEVLLGMPVDREGVAVGGQSLGGLNAYYAAAQRHPRVRAALLFNSGSLDHSSDRHVPLINIPVAYFQGGPRDLATVAGRGDYDGLLSPTTPALWAEADVGHIGTYYQRHGGKMGKVAVAYLKWILRGDEAAKKLFVDPGPDSALVRAGFVFEMKNGMAEL